MTETSVTPAEPTRAEHEEWLRGLLADRGFNPSQPLFDGGPTLGSIVDEFRRISVLEVGPVPGIEWLRTTSVRIDLPHEIQDTLWRAYDRQIRDELDHGAYWGEMFFLLTGQEPREMPWDGDGMGGSNVKLKTPPLSDDAEFNRTAIFTGSAFALGLEGGFMDDAFPDLMKLCKRADIPVVRSMVPLMRQIGHDEVRHVNIHKYVFHALRDTQGPDATATFCATVNAGRKFFGAHEISEKQMARYVGKDKPPTTTQVLGPLHLRLSEEA
jgi:hypothetical protein